MKITPSLQPWGFWAELSPPGHTHPFCSQFHVCGADVPLEGSQGSQSGIKQLSFHVLLLALHMGSAATEATVLHSPQHRNSFVLRYQEVSHFMCPLFGSWAWERRDGNQARGFFWAPQVWNQKNLDGSSFFEHNSSFPRLLLPQTAPSMLSKLPEADLALMMVL